MRTLSKEAEQQVIAAVKQAVDLVDNDGLTPDAAFTKVARAQGWKPTMVKFASHAYNTGRQNAQRESAASSLDKFAEFDLVDPDKVISAIWPSKVKEAEDLGVSAEYTRPPVWLGAQAAKAQREKVASLRGDGPTGATGGKGAVGEASPTVHSAFDRHHRLKRAAAIARTDAAAAYDKLSTNMGRFADYFRKAAMDRQPLAVVDFVARTYHGEKGAALVKWAAGQNRLKEAGYAPGVKLASYPEVDFNIAPWSLIRSCLKLAEVVVEKRATEAAAMTAMEQQAKSELNRFTDEQHTKVSWDLADGHRVQQWHAEENAAAFVPSLKPVPVKEAATEPEAAPEPWSLLKIGNAATSAGIGIGTKEIIEKAFGGGPSRDDAIEKTWLKLEDPSHDAQLRQIRTQALLADLMNDEVIGGYDPERVTTAYNDISQMAPRAAQQPVAIRSLLRRHLQGNVEPFEAKEIADTETAIKNTEAPSTPKTNILRETPSSLLG